MTTPNNAAALECVLDEMGAFIEQEESPNLDTLENWHQRLRATLTQPDALTSQPSGVAVAWMVVERENGPPVKLCYDREDASDWIVSASSEYRNQQCPGPSYRTLPLYAHPSADAPGVAVDDEMIERACKRYAFREDGAVWPDAYSEYEVAAERVLMREFLEHVLTAPAALAPKPEGKTHE